MLMITKVIGKVEDFDLSKYQVDKVRLTHDEMEKGHQRIETENGIEIGISLEDGQVLLPGSVLYASNNEIIVLEGKEEDVLVIEPEGALEWRTICFNLGNFHCSAFFNNDLIMVPYDHIIEKMIQKFHVKFTKERRTLTGVRATAHQH